MSKSVTVPCACCGPTCPPEPDCPDGSTAVVTGTDENDCDIYRCCNDAPSCPYGQPQQSGTDSNGCPRYVCCPPPPTCSEGYILVQTGTDSDGCATYECRRSDTDCCTPTGGCTGYCPGPACDPSDGVCCDNVCITCQDCGDGGEECCNSIEIKSLFTDLSNESEMILWDTVVGEIKESWGDKKLDQLVEIIFKFGIKKDNYWKVSVFARAYVIDCLDDVANGMDINSAYAKHHSEWSKFVSVVRSQS